MKAILEEYGMILVVIAITLIFTLFASPLGNTISDYIGDSLANFYEKANDQVAPGEDSSEEEALPEGMNEYGFYFDKPYRQTTSDGYTDLYFYSDGTAKSKIYTTSGNSMTLTSRDLSYQKNKVLNKDGEVFYIFEDNGKTVINQLSASSNVYYLYE